MGSGTQSFAGPTDPQAGRTRELVLRTLDFVAPPMQEEDRRDFQATLVITWLAWPALASVVVTSMWLLGIELDTPSLSVGLAGACIVPVMVIFSTIRFDPILSSLSGAFAFFATTGPLVVMFTYVLTASGAAFPLFDPWLSHADRLLGFDWKGTLAWADSVARDWPAVETVAKTAYDSLLWQVSGVILALSLSGQYGRLQRFVISYMVSVVAAATICGFIPAVGAYEYYGITPDMHPHLRLTVMNVHLPDYLSLRAGTFETFSLTKANGIITFPSFHSSLAVIFAWAVWRTPFIRWPGLALNVAMLAATPLYGSHFLSDVIAGAAIAPLAILASGRLRERSRRWIGPILGMPPAKGMSA